MQTQDRTPATATTTTATNHYVTSAVRTYAAALGVPLDQLQARTHIGTEAFSALANNTEPWNLDQLEAVCAALAITPYDLTRLAMQLRDGGLA